MFNLSNCLAKCGNVAPAAMAQTTGLHSLLFSRSALLLCAARRASATLSRPARAFAPMKTRPFSTKSGPTERALKSRLMPLVFTGVAFTVMIYLDQRRRPNPFKIELKPESKTTKEKIEEKEVLRMLSPFGAVLTWINRTGILVVIPRT